MIGFKTEYIEVLSFYGKSKYRKFLWRCRCKCGNERIRTTDQIKSGKPISCGCYTQIRRGNMSNHIWHTKHGLANKHPLYRTWKNMKQRCYNPNNPDFHVYGEKGIKLSKVWVNDSGSFLKWGLSHGWKKGLVIDRIDSNKDYSPNNCQFITMSENSKKVHRENPTLHRGSNHRDATINEETVLKIRLDLKRGLRQLDIRKKYNISHNMAYQIANFKTWKHVMI